MKKFTKIMSLVLAMVLCVGVGVGATLAWLTDRTEEVVNTFAPTKLIVPGPDPDPEYKGNNFEIWEHKATTKEDGTTDLGTTLVHENKYDRVLPGIDQMKDPFVRIKAQEDAYVYVEIVDTLPDTMTWAIDNTKWTRLTVAGHPAVGPYDGEVYVYSGTIQGVVGYITPGMGSQNINILKDTKVVVDKTFVPESLTPGQTDTLTFYAYAAQHAGQDTAEAAWTSAAFAPVAP